MRVRVWECFDRERETERKREKEGKRERDSETCHFHCDCTQIICIVSTHLGECLDNFSGHRTDYVPIIAYVSQDFNWIWLALVPPIIICKRWALCATLFLNLMRWRERRNKSKQWRRVKSKHISLDFSFRFVSPANHFQAVYSTHAWRIEFTFRFAIIFLRL